MACEWYLKSLFLAQFLDTYLSIFNELSVIVTDYIPLVLESVNHSLFKAEKYYRCSFPVGEVLFNLRGRAAGQVRFPLSKHSRDLPEIRFNPSILNIYGEAFIREVVPHECAHLVVHRLFQLKKYKSKIRPKPHGTEWQFIMRELYGLTPRVTHTFEVHGSRMKQFPYICACEGKVHQISIIRHNKVLKQTSNYVCRRCGEKLMYSD